MKLQVEKMDEEMEQLRQKLSLREKQIETQARELAVLQEQNSQLSNSTSQLEAKATASEQEVISLKSEYGGRLQAEQKRVQALTKERDALRRLTTIKAPDENTQQKLREKEQQLEQVLAEGNALSKRVGEQDAVVRKLRGQVKDLEASENKAKKRVEELELKVETLMQQILQYENDRQVLEERVTQSQDFDVIKVELDKTREELSESKKQYIQLTVQAEQKARDAEERVRESMNLVVAQKLRESQEREASIATTVQELRANLAQQSVQANYREERHRKEIEELKRRCEAAESRTEELSTSMPEATRPLLRQIEQMHSAAASRQSSWDAVERSLTARLQDAESTAAIAVEKERTASNKANELSIRISLMESQIASITVERARLQSELDLLRHQFDEASIQGRGSAEELTSLRMTYRKSVQQAAEQENRLKSLLVEEHERLEEKERMWEAEKARLEEMLENARSTTLPTSSSSILMPTPIRDRDGPSGNGPFFRPLALPRTNSVQSDDIYQRHSGHPDHTSSPDTVNPDTPREVPITAAAIERLTALLKQREGELSTLQQTVLSLEKTRDVLVDELSQASVTNKKLAEDSASVEELRNTVQELQARYAAALEMMGEREEQVNELQADLMDHKMLYREQITDLMDRIESLQRQTAAVR